MEVTKETIYTTAELLQVAIDDKEAEALTVRFANLLDYFSVLDKVTEEREDIGLQGDDILRIRDGEESDYQDSHTLIERSEEHEDNYVIIPNIL